MYADDTVMYCEISKNCNLKRKIDSVNEELAILGDWCRCNKLTINVDKTKCMMLTSTEKKYNLEFKGKNIDLFLNGMKLGYISNYRYLGIEVDSHLAMDNHVNYVIGRVRPLLFTLKKLRYYLLKT